MSSFFIEVFVKLRDLFDFWCTQKGFFVSQAETPIGVSIRGTFVNKDIFVMRIASEPVVSNNIYTIIFALSFADFVEPINCLRLRTCF